VTAHGSSFAFKKPEAGARPTAFCDINQLSTDDLRGVPTDSKAGPGFQG
jgi:hypothetical protein